MKNERRTPPERGYGWLPAVVPASARRFRVSDPALAAVLTDAGADLVASRPDVEIAPVEELRGDASVSIALLGHPARVGRPLPVRVMRRLAKSGQVRLDARRARRAMARLGHPTVTVLTWDHQRALHGSLLIPAGSGEDLADHFPQRALVVGRGRPDQSTLVETVLEEADKATEGGLRVNAASVRAGSLIIDTSAGILRIAIGSGSRQIRKQRAALETLQASECPPVVSERLPWLIAAGRSGLADWSFERRLPGARLRPPVRGRLLNECLDFLVALHPACASPPRRGIFLEQAEAVAACARGEAGRAHALAERLESLFAEVPRGFMHGDFFHGNLLVEKDRLAGVADWDAAGPARLPVVDLLHFRHSMRQRAHVDWGPALVRELLPWARDGGDDFLRTYCSRLGVETDGKLLEALVLAYWLDYVSYRLQTHAYQAFEPHWVERNVSFVLDAVG